MCGEHVWSFYVQVGPNGRRTMMLRGPLPHDKFSLLKNIDFLFLYVIHLFLLFGTLRILQLRRFSVDIFPNDEKITIFHLAK
jgi:hypothetical protein